MDETTQAMYERRNQILSALSEPLDAETEIELMAELAEIEASLPIQDYIP